MKDQSIERIDKALDQFRIEIPSWGFANTGTRFGKFIQDAAATTTAEKFADAGEVFRLTGITPTVALHVLWDMPKGLDDIPVIRSLERKYGVRAGSINPNLFQAQEYKFGSIANPSAEIRQMAIQHMLDSVEIAKGLESRDLSIWVADGSNYPGTQSIRRRIGWMEEAMSATHAALGPNQRMLIEYKPFEPAFYHTDIADWGMAMLLCQASGSQGQGARRHRTSSPGHQHRTDHRVADRERTASAVFTSMTGSMPTTISPSDRSIPTSSSASSLRFSRLVHRPIPPRS